jgi:hypothetical protein
MGKPKVLTLGALPTLVAASKAASLSRSRRLLCTSRESPRLLVLAVACRKAAVGFRYPDRKTGMCLWNEFAVLCSILAVDGYLAMKRCTLAEIKLATVNRQTVN